MIYFIMINKSLNEHHLPLDLLLIVLPHWFNLDLLVRVLPQRFNCWGLTIYLLCSFFIVEPFMTSQFIRAIFLPENCCIYYVFGCFRHLAGAQIYLTSWLRVLMVSFIKMSVCSLNSFVARHTMLGENL